MEMFYKNTFENETVEKLFSIFKNNSKQRKSQMCLSLNSKQILYNFDTKK